METKNALRFECVAVEDCVFWASMRPLKEDIRLPHTKTPVVWSETRVSLYVTHDMRIFGLASFPWQSVLPVSGEHDEEAAPSAWKRSSSINRRVSASIDTSSRDARVSGVSVKWSVRHSADPLLSPLSTSFQLKSFSWQRLPTYKVM